jgi:hypothetical protein
VAILRQSHGSAGPGGRATRSLHGDRRPQLRAFVMQAVSW